MHPGKLLTLLLLLAGIASAQFSRGVISGTVEDISGAVIDGAVVRVVSQAANFERTTISNRTGTFRVPALDPGIYTVELSKEGFAPKRLESVRVEPAQEVVLKETLAIGPTASVVTVEEPPAGVDLSKATPTIGFSVDERLVRTLPLTIYARDVNQLAYLSPLVTRTAGSSQISAGGQRGRNNNFLIDGIDNNDPGVAVANLRVIPEQISEYHIQTQAYSAEFGRNTGGQIQVITRSGGNEFHGEAFNYYRANWMEPVSLLNKRSNLTENPRFVQNQAGGALGGPIVRDRTFFFALVETNRYRDTPDARNATPVAIPTPDGFAALSNLPLGPNQTVESRQAALAAIGFLPEVHRSISAFQSRVMVPVNGVPVEFGQARMPGRSPADLWYGSTRIDHQLTTRDVLGYRAQFDRRFQPNVASNLGFGDRFSAANDVMRQNHALSHIRTFSPRFVNEARFSYVRATNDLPENDPTTPTTDIRGFFMVGGQANFPQLRRQDTYQFQNTASYLMGRHSLRMGMDFRRTALFNESGQHTKGTWTFDSFADFMNNRPAMLVQAVRTATFDARQNSHSYFIQDDWRATRNLTINLGLRYEYTTIPFGFFGAADETIAAAGVPRDTRPDRNNWAPRLGFAYSPGERSGVLGKLLGDGRTVIRGGYGIAYDVLFLNLLQSAANNFPRVYTPMLDRTQLVNAYPSPVAPPMNQSFNPFVQFVNVPTEAQNPTTHFYSFSIQRRVRQNYVFEIGYAGARSYHGIRQSQANPGTLTEAQAAQVIAARNPNAIPGLQARRVNPAWGSRVLIEPSAWADYHAGYVRFDRKFARGLLIGGNYTWSANFSDGDEAYNQVELTASTPQVPQDFRNYRNDWSRSAFDRPHRVSVYYTYDIPWFHAPALQSPVVRAVFADWLMSGTMEAQSGQPFTIRTGVDSAGVGVNASARPDYNPAGIFAPDPVTGNLRSFTTPIHGTGIFVTPLTAAGSPLANSMPGGGNLGRNAFRGPGFQNWNFSLRKTVSMTERWKLELSGHWVNLWNQRNFGNPVALMNSPAFGSNFTDPGARWMLANARIRF